MTLSTNKPFSKPSYGKGIFIAEARVHSIEDVSGTTPHPMTSSVDIGVRLALDIGREFYPEMLIAGSFKKNSAGEVVGWGSAFPVQELFSKLGYKGDLNNDNTIPDAALQAMLGKKFLRLSFISGSKRNGKPFYSDWNVVGTTEEGPEALAQRFRASLAKGYPKNYRPELMDDASLTEETPAPVPLEEGEVF